jgi:hypothetical protein
MQNTTDDKVAVPMVEATKAQFPCFNACSLASFIPKFTLFAITAFIKQEKAIPFGVQINQKNLQFIVH